ncbi:putative ribosomally synthesized six-cysteine peptide SCIFF [Symbiobacterium terraclitae]|uniref:Ribosomally synthesized six-cysteine peptide SCIFF n=1 Tax=Symbiobacterium terraclitae TaxID=557451 RepID=A0ABS4JRV8_9FIRM|nr:putative ribosomally synthesized six-cysteine peptide SCIFF [Symbiobacterium terraclitae]
MTKHIRTLTAPRLQATVQHVGCTDCAVSCQSACKTSCTVGNIVCSVSSLTSPAAEQVRVHDVTRR